MLPTSILKWAERYDINSTIMWEIVETVTNVGDDLDYIRDEPHLFDLTVEWACAMIESVAEESTNENLQTFTLYYLPVVFALAPHLDTLQRARLIASAYERSSLVDAIRIMLVRSSTSPTPPNQLR
jgi:hypothetical protein